MVDTKKWTLTTLPSIAFTWPKLRNDEVLEMMHCSIFFAVLSSRGTDVLNDRPERERGRREGREGRERRGLSWQFRVWEISCFRGAVCRVQAASQ